MTHPAPNAEAAREWYGLHGTRLGSWDDWQPHFQDVLIKMYHSAHSAGYSAGLEAAAEVCNNEAEVWGEDDAGPMAQMRAQTGSDLASAIRALKADP